MGSIYTVSNGPALDSARIGFHVAFLQKLGLTQANALEDLYTTVASSKKIEQWDWIGDLPDFVEWVGDRVMSELSAYTLSVTNKRWANGIKVTDDELADDTLGLLGPAIEGLAERAKTHRIRLMVKALLNGFDGTAYPDLGTGLAYDGKFFFSTTRSTGSNKMTTALTGDAAGLAALQAAELLLESQTTYDGVDMLEIMGTDLIIGPKLVPAVQFLMKADYMPSNAGTASQSNILKGRYKVHVSPLLRGAYDDYWFLADLSKSIKPMIFQMREEITTSALSGNGEMSGAKTPEMSQIRFQRGENWFGAQARYNVAPFEPRVIVGSAL